MHKLVIHKLGPIEHCEMECSHFMTLTGFQASGKSTIAKAIYFFRTIKDDIIELAKEQALDLVPENGLPEDQSENRNGLRKKLEDCLREKFLRTFGSAWGMSSDMYLEYCFTETCTIRISLVNDTGYTTPNYIWITLSNDLKEFLWCHNRCLSATVLGVPEEELKKFRNRLYRLLDDPYMVVYVPAGRSMITLLSQQINYIYAKMDDTQKRLIDSCTRDYLERILRLKPEFSEGLKGLMVYRPGNGRVSPDILEQALILIKKILRGTYRYSNGEEQIVLDNGKYVKINFSSSGQQESVWILNLLFYYLLHQNPVLFIIEEPESHLFPESQKYITELIALAGNCKHSVLLTTHSPYVLGTLNNLLYAHTVQGNDRKAAEAIIPGSIWIDWKKFDSWFVQNGVIDNCMDGEIHMIQNERIDEISKVINQDFDKLLELENTDEGSVVV